MNRLVFLCCFLLHFSLFSQTPAKVTVILDDNRGSKDFFENVKSEIDVLLGNRYQISFDKKVLGKDLSPTPSAINQAMAESDVFITLGFISSNLLSNLNQYPVPSIAGFSLERTQNESTNINNYNYIQSPFSIEKDFEIFQSIYPFKNLGVFVEPQLLDGLAPYLNKYKSDFEVEFIPISQSPSQDIEKLSSKVDAVYFLPNLYESPQKEQELIDAISDKGLPSFSLIGRRDVKKGIMASNSPSNYINIYGRRIALSVMKILEGQNAKDLPIQIGGIEEDFVINTSTMKKIKIYPPLEVLSKASFVGLEDSSGKNYTLSNAIAEALDNNLSFQAEKKNIDLQRKEVGIAKSNIFPDISANSNLTYLDNESAERLTSANQLTPQTQWSGNLALSQLIYSEPALANISIQKSLLKAQKYGVLSNQLDLVLDVCTAYIRLLQAQANLNIQNNNVQTTLVNLNIAKTKANIGTISLADVHGFESQLALNKSALNDAQTTVEQAKISFNQLLNRPLDSNISLEDVQISDKLVFIADPRIQTTINNRYDITRFSQFLIDYALRHSPSINQIKYSIKAQERSLKSNKRSLYHPQLAVQGNLDKTFGRYGTRITDETLETIGIDPYHPTGNVTLRASLPLFQGNLRNLKIQKDKIAVDQLSTNRELLEQTFSANIRYSLENLGNAYNDILFTQQAETSSEKFLQIIQDLYKEGATNIVTLLDAQNNALSTKLNTIYTRYQFLIDALTIERLVNKFYLLSTQKEKDDFINEYFNYIIQNN